MKRLLAIVFISLLTGCATYDPMFTQAHKDKVNTVKVISVIPQEEIRIQIHTSTIANGQYGGLVGALADTVVNNSRAKKSESMSDSLRNALIDVNINDLLEQSYKKSLKSISWAEITSFESKATLSTQEIKSIMTSMQEDALFIITSEYSISPGQEFLEIDAQIKAYEKYNDPKLLRNFKIGDGLFRFQSKVAHVGGEEYRKKAEIIEQQYNEKLKDKKTKEERRIVRRWRNRELQETEESLLRPIKEKHKADLKAKIAKINEKYEEKKEQAKNESQLKEIREKQRRARGKVKKQARVSTPKQKALNDEWLANNASLLHSEVKTGINEIGHLISLILGDQINEKELDSKSVKIPTKNLENRYFDGKTPGYLIGESEDGSRVYYIVKRSLGDISYADYYVIPKSEKIYPRLNRK